MKTLVIHPMDESTDFLKEIYNGKGYTVITDGKIPNRKLYQQIRKHDRIMMLGHGTQYGLLSGFDYVVQANSLLLQALLTKETVCIWCHADIFVKKYGLRGFFTGMMVSELPEAEYCEVPATHEEIAHSNWLFAKVIGDNIEEKRSDMFFNVQKDYAGDSEVIKFNQQRIYYN